MRAGLASVLNYAQWLRHAAQLLPAAGQTRRIGMPSPERCTQAEP